MSHTKGPWRTEECSGGGLLVIRDTPSSGSQTHIQVFPVDDARLIAAAPELLKALKRTQRLINLVTVRAVIEAGDDAIDAAGLNPWCMNEGLATGDEQISAFFIDAAITEAEGK